MSWGERYADAAIQVRGVVQEHVQLALDTYRIRIDCAEIAGRICPGQFVMVGLPEGDDPLLARPLALYDTVRDAQGTPLGIDLVYLVVGKLTSRLVQLGSGDTLDLWGPLGNGFPSRTTEHLIMVAGGIGQTPFPAVAAEALGRAQYGDPPRSPAQAARVTLCYGARTAEALAGIDDFQRLGVEVRVSTDDGSAGHAGLVTALLEQVLDAETGNCRVVCCGPEPMMEAVAQIAASHGAPCEVSLETPMACGIGICFSCVAKVRQDDGTWDYRRTCVEGPVFPAEQIVWDE